MGEHPRPFNIGSQLLNSQLVCLLPDAIFDHVMFIYIYIFYHLFPLIVESPIGEVISLYKRKEISQL